MDKVKDAQLEYNCNIWTKASDLDENYFPEAVQVIPTNDYKVYSLTKEIVKKNHKYG